MILVTGACGMMGSHLLDVFEAGELYRTDLHETDGVHALDCRDYAAVTDMIGRVRPDVVLHMAAETDVDRCEREVEHAFKSNAMATLHVALACQRTGATLVYVSTAGVFDGLKPEPYTEFDTPNPVNVYARAKLEGEKIVQSLVPRHYIVRAGWMFGGKGKDKKFVGKIAAQCTAGGAERPELKAVNDKFGCPTYADDLLRTVQRLLDTGLYGLYHVVNTGSCSRYDVAVEIARLLGADVHLAPVSSANFPLSAPRPRSEASRAFKLDLIGLSPMRDWKVALADYLLSWVRSNYAATAPVHVPARVVPHHDVHGWDGVERRRAPVPAAIARSLAAAGHSHWDGIERRGARPALVAIPSHSQAAAAAR